MADDVKIKASISGVDEIVSAAKKVETAWSGVGKGVSAAMGAAGSMISSTMGAIGSDISRAALATSRISLDQAITSSREFESSVQRAATASGVRFGELQGKIEKVSQATGQKANTVAAWAQSLNRVTYDYKGALDAAGALNDEALRTGRSFEDMIPLGASMHDSLGVAGKDTADVLNTVRAQVDALGTSGGVAALTDQINAASGAIAHMSVKTVEQKKQLLALAAGFGGKDATPQERSRGFNKILSRIEANPYGFGRYLVGEELRDEKGHLKVDAPEKVWKAMVKRYGKKRALENARATFGDEEGSLLASTDWDAIRNAPMQGVTDKATDDFLKTKAGKRQATEAKKDKGSRELVSGAFSSAADRIDQAAAEHPMMAYLTQNLPTESLRAAGAAYGAKLLTVEERGGVGKTLEDVYSASSGLTFQERLQLGYGGVQVRSREEATRRDPIDALFSKEPTKGDTERQTAAVQDLMRQGASRELAELTAKALAAELRTAPMQVQVINATGGPVSGGGQTQ